jgi:hypothetical protein
MTHTRHVVGLIALLFVGLYVVTAYAPPLPLLSGRRLSQITVAH